MTAESLVLATTDGERLEAEIDVPADAVAGVVLCHPHPLYGGSMSDGVLDALFRALPARRIGALRFNFRGVGASSGTHDGGDAERHDVTAAIDALATALDTAGTTGPLVVAGWSFGADVSLSVPHPRVAGWSPIAPPLRVVAAERFEAVATDPRPKLLLCPEHDQFNPPSSATGTVAGWATTEVVTVPGADHFLLGHGAFLVDAVTGFVQRLSPGAATGAGDRG
jgi:uncharacterized protein